MEWVAFERVHGPLLLHERIDYMGAMICTVLANLYSKHPIPFRRFLPPWYDVPLGDAREGFARLLEMADADDKHPDG